MGSGDCAENSFRTENVKKGNKVWDLGGKY